MSDAPVAVAWEVILNVADQLDESTIGHLGRGAVRVVVERAAG